MLTSQRAARSPDDPVVIAAATRTPLGAFLGALSEFTAPELGAIAIRAAVNRAPLNVDNIDEVLMGCVLMAGLGQAPTRQAALLAGLAAHTPCTTVNKVCGSGMKAIMLGHDALMAGTARVVIAGGMESMSNAPYLLPRARSGQRLGHGQMLDHIFTDGLEDSCSQEMRGHLMGRFAEDCATHFQLTRDQQDAFALASAERANAAALNGCFTWETAPIQPKQTGSPLIQDDEGPSRTIPSKVATLKPAFKPNGTVTAANASSIVDGAAALVLMRQSHATRLGLQTLAIIRGHASHAQAPQWFTTAPAPAIRKLLAQLGWATADVDLWEINEAFAVVTLAAMQALSLPHEKVNVHGGACALGHPIGASGARIVVSLLGALRRRGLHRGVASLCIGGGEATAIAIERA
jgi:acetyl-CoA C-acetyltransferase